MLSVIAVLLTFVLTVIGSERLSKNDPPKAGLGAIFIVLAMIPACTHLYTMPLLPIVPLVGCMIGGAILITKASKSVN